MDTIPVRNLPDTAPPPLPAAPASGRVGSRWVLPVALFLVAVQLGLRTWLFAQRQYYADDLRLLNLSDRSPLFSADYLLYDFDGHLMPGSFLVAGLVERAAPLEWAPALVSLVVLQALASLALLRVLWVLLGDRPVLLVPLAFGLFTPITLGALTWWAAALNSIPLQIGLAWYVAAAVRAGQTGRRRYALSGTLALAFALAFYLKAVLLPPVAFVVVVVALLRDGVRNPLWAALRRAWLLWLGTAVVAALWAATYLSTRTDDVVSDGSASDVWITITTGFEALAPAVFSGPFRWAIFPPASPLSDPTDWTVTAGWLVLAAAFVWTCVRLRGALPVWLITGATIFAGLLMAAVGRSGLGLGEVAPLAYRYFAADAVLLPIAGALLVSLPVRRIFRRAPGRPGRARRWLAPLGAALTTVLTVGFIANCVLSTVSHARAWEGNRAGEYLDVARASLTDAGPAPLLDQILPADVVVGMNAPADRLFGVFAPLPDRPAFASSTPVLQVLDDSGELRPAEVIPGVVLAEGPAAGCGWSIEPGAGSTVGLTGALPVEEWTVELRYVSEQDGEVTVVMGSGPPERAPVVAGAHSVYLRISGGGPALQVTSEVPGLRLCVTAGVVGEATPLP
ncbi:hypothetical protein SAMN05660748_3598 [Blastococcus aggregatus]|uniref:4-amino-4-deoxy-L-arabinose transferase n=1 Tax=Blastococcus aggregatus TaxID=38502 RepID=A0A285V9U7_9ACTN|nr:hypothetical protein [Blastococcus aggregatus]SOC50839.1 hypothetical protein SAMN05660748_3598 [Blastococcus aggregatus]